jgi:hypothetical protein
MSISTDFERAARAWLDDGPTQLSDRVLHAALNDIHVTRQRRAISAPWRFVRMPVLSRATGIAAVALVAVVGAGAMYVASNRPSGSGSQGTPAPTVAPTPAPTYPGIRSFTPYTSAVYGITFGYPDGWSLAEAATRKWQAGDQVDTGSTDLFVTPADGEEGIAFAVWQGPAGPGADIASHAGLAAWFEANLCEEGGDPCGTVAAVAVPMCAGTTACFPAIVVPKSDGVLALLADAEKRVVTIVFLGRGDRFPATARYGGGIRLLKSILTTFDVREPRPGETPH